MKPKTTRIQTIYGIGKKLELADPYGKDYPRIINHILGELAKNRPFYNYLDLDLHPLRLFEPTIPSLKKLEGSQDELHIRWHIPFKGKSVTTARETVAKDQALLSVVHIAQIIMNDRTVLEKYEDTWLDCAADQCN